MCMQGQAHAHRLTFEAQENVAAFCLAKTRRPAQRNHRRTAAIELSRRPAMSDRPGVIPARTEKPHTLFARRIGGQSALRSTKLVVVLPLFMQRGERQLWRIFHTDEYCRLDVTDQSKYKCGIIETLWRVGVSLLSSGPSSNCKSTARGI